MRMLALVALSVALSACTEQKPAAPAAAPVPAPAPVAAAKVVSVLVTGHETGLLVARAPRLLAQWREKERWPEAIALSTGDMFSGQALSSHFLGEPTAQVMKAMQYRAGVLGNHDLDLGPQTLRDFRASSGLKLLAANLVDRPGADEPLKAEPFTVIEREGVKVGIVGLTSFKTITTVVAGRSAGLELKPVEEVLPAALLGARKAGADAVVVLVDDCFTILATMFEQHPDWKADLVVGSRCDAENEKQVNGMPFFSVGDNLSHYVSARIEVTGGKVAVKAVRTALDEQGAEDADLLALRARWQEKLDKDLGTVIGFSQAGYKADAPQLRTLVATALKEKTKSDAALINKKGIREGLAKGPITAAAVYSMIPFENAVLTVIVTGEVLEQLKTRMDAVLVLPPKVEKGKTYQLATTEYLYFGGDGLGLDTLAPSPELTGQVWQTPVVEWLTSLKSDEKRPLEKLLK